MFSRAWVRGFACFFGITSVMRILSGESFAMNIIKSFLLFTNWSVLVYKKFKPFLEIFLNVSLSFFLLAFLFVQISGLKSVGVSTCLLKNLLIWSPFCGSPWTLQTYLESGDSFSFAAFAPCTYFLISSLSSTV